MNHDDEAPLWEPESATPPAPVEASPEPKATAHPGLVAAAVLAAVVASGVSYLRYSDGGDTAYAVGAAFGPLFAIALIGGLLWRYVSPNAGVVAALVIAVGGTVANVGEVAERNSAEREIAQAIDDLGLETERFEPTRVEEACLRNSDFDPDDILDILTDTSQSAGATQLEFFDVVARCAPRALLTDLSVEQFRTSFSLGAPGEIDATEARCILTDIVELPKPSEVMTGDDPTMLFSVLEGCMTPESMEALFGGAGTGPQLIGDDPTLDRLAERCEAGADPACDVLLALSSAGSEYAEIATDCAGRGLNSPLLACTAGFTDADGNGFYDEDSPGWDTIFAACHGGDMLACDFAFTNSELGSTAERVGETCGERRALQVGGTCIDRYGETAE